MDIESILDDVRNEPPWRWVANREMAYRDCNQLDAAMLRAMEEIGMLPIQRPMIGAIMDSVLGVEALTRRDFVVLANEDDATDEAKALSRRMKDVEDRAGADRAISDAYEGEACVGVGWVEVGREPNPFRYPHRARAAHRRELWWDWRGGGEQEDWRYLVRRKWYDADVLAARFARHALRIRAAAAGDTPFWASEIETTRGGRHEDDEELFRAGLSEWELERDTAFADADWRDTARKRLCLWEVWYRVYDPGAVLRLLAPGGEDIVIEYEPGNPRHRMLVDAGLAEVERTVLQRMRLAWYLGPHKLADIPSPYPHEEFPYVFFGGFQEDRTGMWYGLIRRMMSGQDQINAGLTKMFYLMASTLVMGDEDAFALPLDEVAERIGEKNCVLPLNPNRANKHDKPVVQTDRQLAAQHFQALQEAQQTLGPNAGVHNAYQGKGMDSQSGVAINSLVEQASTGLAKLNSRYIEGRKKVGGLLLANEVERMSGREFYQVIEKDRRPEQIYFNRREVDADTGAERLTNDLDRLHTRVKLADAPATASFKQQMAQGLMSLVETLPDELKGPLIPMLVRAGDYPDREEIAQLIERRLGIGGNPDPAEELNRARERALAQQTQQLALEQGQAKTREGNARADKLEAEVEQLRAEIAAMAERFRAMAQARAMADAVAQGTMTVLPPPALPMGAAAVA